MRWKINAVTVVNNNASGNQSKRGFDRAYGGQQTEQARELWTFNRVNFARIAEEMGALGIRVERPADFAPALERALAAGRPVVSRRRDRYRRDRADGGGVVRLAALTVTLRCATLRRISFVIHQVNMPVSLRLPETVKKRIAKLAKAQDLTPHGFMLDAIREKLEAEEARAAFHAEAEAQARADEEDRYRHSSGRSVRVPEPARRRRPRSSGRNRARSCDRLRCRGARRSRADLRVQLRARPGNGARTHRPDAQSAVLILDAHPEIGRPAGRGSSLRELDHLARQDRVHRALRVLARSRGSSASSPSGTSARPATAGGKRPLRLASPSAANPHRPGPVRGVRA